MTPDPRVLLRRYAPLDEAPTIELWRRSWQQNYPSIDFSRRVAWWQERWRQELLAAATVTVAEGPDGIIGFVTVNAATGYLDQIVVAPESWGRGVAEALLAEARRQSPAGLDLHVNVDNRRAIRFYEKHGFRQVGHDVNPISGRPVYHMSWRP
ncbi:MAG TPA: GNAT family N-acetyltransferase [Xanthobacteraceae bacterium]|nr:GNAT family N-acetyltransferase [Xanthobacteraceae bacterium]